MQFLYTTVKRGLKSIGERAISFTAERKEMFARFAELMLVAAIFFGLGILYTGHLPARTMPLSVEIPAQEKIIATTVEIDTDLSVTSVIPIKNQTYVASKNGSKYYLTTCKNTIKEANKVFFKTKADAEKAGFKPSQTCFK
ncbi:MAG: hypothetical protein NUV61_01145 [Candidatus Azambacteria bacterium]|nr:hypothetical protein [Candidatus Azambacteria bacterium]